MNWLNWFIRRGLTTRRWLVDGIEICGPASSFELCNPAPSQHWNENEKKNEIFEREKIYKNIYGLSIIYSRLYSIYGPWDSYLYDKLAHIDIFWI